jgi:molecular chaperone DnaK (HSP70)
MILSVVLVRDDGEILVGEAADRRAATEPSRVARDFKRRLGDPSPLFPEAPCLRRGPHGASCAMSWSAREREGGSPTGTVITHPASWSSFKIDLLRDAVRQASIDDAVLMTEPEAAALHYGAAASRCSRRASPSTTSAAARSTRRC